MGVVKDSLLPIQVRPLKNVHHMCIYSCAFCVVKEVVKAAAVLGLEAVGCNLGPVAEFTSKCICIIKAHHAAGKFIAPIFRLPVSSQPTPLQCSSGSSSNRSSVVGPLAIDFGAENPQGSSSQDKIKRKSKGLGPNSTTPNVPDLHFWVSFHPGKMAVEELRQPDSLSARPRNALAQRLIVGALSKSHGSYSGARISFVFEDSTLTLGLALSISRFFISFVSEKHMKRQMFLTLLWNLIFNPETFIVQTRPALTPTQI
jgi:hypothetical protein